MESCTRITGTMPLIAPLMADNSVKIETMLDQVELIALHSLKGLECFALGNYPLLDPSIGDESCQIRALMMLTMKLSEGELKEAQVLLLELIEKVKALRLNQKKESEEIRKQELAAKEPIAVKKKALENEKNQHLKPFKKGSPEADEVMRVFKAAMGVLTIEEKPLTEKYKNMRADLEAKTKLAISSLDPMLSKQMRQIILCYIVCKTKFVEKDEENPNYKTAHDKSRIAQLKIDDLSFDGIEKIVNQAKVILNKESVEFLILQSKELRSKRASLISALMEKPLPSKNNLSEVSFYHQCELILKRARDLGIPIVVKFRDPATAYDNFSKTTVSYLPKGKKYIPGDLEAHQPVLVIEGASQRAGSIGLEKVIEESGGLMKMAKLNLSQHRLCTGHDKANPQSLSKLGVSQEEIARIEQERSKSQIIGCGEHNMSNFRIEHIYADKMSYPIS